MVPGMAASASVPGSSQPALAPAPTLRAPYRIRTARLDVRVYRPADAEELRTISARNKEHLLPWMPWARLEPEPLEKKLDRILRFRGSFDLGQDFIYGVFEPEDGALVGGTGLHPRCGPGGFEIGYWIDHEREGRGYATEVSAALVRVGIELLGARRIEIHCEPANVRSTRIPAKLGFTLEGILRARLEVEEGKYRDKAVHTLLAEEFRAGPLAQTSLACFDALDRPIPFPEPISST